nr:MAG TPA: hypothetical protein [Bacteriophage sp.]
MYTNKEHPTQDLVSWVGLYDICVFYLNSSG